MEELLATELDQKCKENEKDEWCGWHADSCLCHTQRIIVERSTALEWYSPTQIKRNGTENEAKKSQVVIKIDHRRKQVRLP